MPRSAFPWPGGKTMLADWIIQHFPDHRCYCEPFAGSAAVLLNKPRSRSEVINDTDDELVHFYRMAKTRPEELSERLQTIPYAETRHDAWKRHLSEKDWPEDDIERAARWFFLRYSQHSAKVTRPSGFKTARATNPARAFHNGRGRLDEIAERLDGVQIMSRDWFEVAQRKDAEDTLFYLDVPYVGAGDDLYNHGEFDHEQFVSRLGELEGDWIVSYEQLPEGLEEYHVVEQPTTYSGSAREGGECKDATERLVMNFDPEARTAFAAGNERLTRFTA